MPFTQQPRTNMFTSEVPSNTAEAMPRAAHAPAAGGALAPAYRPAADARAGPGSLRPESVRSRGLRAVYAGSARHPRESVAPSRRGGRAAAL